MTKKTKKCDLLEPTEFDAYSKEITEYIKQTYKNPENRKNIKQWLISTSFGENDKPIRLIPNMPIHLFIIINFWKQNNPSYTRKLRQRIYNEVIVNENTI